MKKILGLVFLSFLFSNMSYADCIKGDCKNGYGEYIYKDGTKYLGNFKKGKEHGKGKLIFTDGGIYEGDFLKDRAHGEGKRVFASGCIYEGSFKKNKFDGFAIYKCKMHRDSKLNGKINMTYTGYFKKNLFHGEGKVEWEDGIVWHGEFKKDVFVKDYNEKKNKIEKENKNKEVQMATMINKSKNTCKVLGFEEGTEKFSDCALKLYTQEVELAAKQNQQVVAQSNSGVMTIYDPVRDNQRMIDQGMKMLSGRCTLGIDC